MSSRGGGGDNVLLRLLHQTMAVVRSGGYGTFSHLSETTILELMKHFSRTPTSRLLQQWLLAVACTCIITFVITYESTVSTTALVTIGDVSAKNETFYSVEATRLKFMPTILVITTFVTLFLKVSGLLLFLCSSILE